MLRAARCVKQCLRVAWHDVIGMFVQSPLLWMVSRAMAILRAWDWLFQRFAHVWFRMHAVAIGKQLVRFAVAARSCRRSSLCRVVFLTVYYPERLQTTEGSGSSQGCFETRGWWPRGLVVQPS